MILYEDNGKIAYFDGLKFTRDNRTGYYLNATLRLRLHRAVWASENGPIPEGMDIHHKDGNRNNNELSNLEALSSPAHHKRHSDEQTNEQKIWRRDNMNQKARPAAIRWHQSQDGRKWHKEHYENMRDKLNVQHMFVCEQCGIEFSSSVPDSRFCSNKCKSAWRRASGVDNITLRCEYCGREFVANKYRKSRFCSKSCANKAEPRLPALRKNQEHQ